jgi:hypothetical protein
MMRYGQEFEITTVATPITQAALDHMARYLAAQAEREMEALLDTAAVRGATTYVQTLDRFEEVETRLQEYFADQAPAPGDNYFDVMAESIEALNAHFDKCEAAVAQQSSYKWRN